MWFSTLILMSVALILQNLRIGLKNRLCNKSDTLTETRGKWQKDKATFFSSSDVRCLPASSSTKPEEGKFVVDSGVSMHMLSRERPELSWTGDRQNIQKPSNGFYSQWWSANKRGSNSARQRFGFIRDSTDPPGYARSSIAWETLRRSLIFLWVEQWTRTTSDEKRKDNTMQHREFRAHRCSQIVSRTFQLDYEYTLNIGIARLSRKWFYDISSKYTK